MVHATAAFLTITLIITATSEPGECCVQTVNASAASENVTETLTTPGYPAGVSTSYDCVWIIDPIGKERIRVEIEPDGAATTCDDVKLTFRDGFATGDEADTWCPGQPTIYQSVKGALNISVSLSAGRNLRIKYTALEESSCVKTLDITDEIQTITTPGYPNAFPSFTDCRWTFAQLHKRIQIEIIDSDIKESSGCTADVVNIVEWDFNDNRLPSRVSSKCNNSVPVTYITAGLFTVVSFKAWRVNQLNKGLVLTFRKIANEPCGGELSASSVPQTFHSPGYPEYEPNDGLCFWTLRADDPTKSIQVQVESKLGGDATCSIFPSYVGVIEGTALNETVFQNRHMVIEPEIYESTGTYLMALVCNGGNRTVKSFTNAVSVIYRSNSPIQGQGFLINYMAVSGDFKGNREVLAFYESHALISPRFPDGQVQNADITWTITSFLKSYGDLVLLDIYDTDLGDGSNCNENNIKVYDGNTTTSPLLTTLCGKEVAAFFKPVLLISFKTDSNLGRKGFRSKFQSEKYSCNKREVNLSWFISDRTVQSFNYPGNYPVDLPCSYIVRAEEQSNYININIQDMDFDCNAGYLEIYDGANNTAPVLLKTCGKKTKSIDSGHNVIYVSVVSSNSNPVGKGFKIMFKSTKRVPVGLIVGVVVGVVALLGLAALGAFLYQRKRK